MDGVVLVGLVNRHSLSMTYPGERPDVGLIVKSPKAAKVGIRQRIAKQVSAQCTLSASGISDADAGYFNLRNN